MSARISVCNGVFGTIVVAVAISAGLAGLPRPTRAAGVESVWSSVGPTTAPLAYNGFSTGPSNAVAVHPNNAGIIYVGSSDGGLWKHADGTWTPLTDDTLVRTAGGRTVSTQFRKATLRVGSVVVHPGAAGRPETIYVGTGNPQVLWETGTALGVFVSRDGGATWIALGENLSTTGCDNAAMSQRIVNKLLLRGDRSPVDLFAATDLGIFRLVEGTDCWHRIVGGSVRAMDLAWDPVRDIIYTTIYGQGVFRTDDDGASFTPAGTDLPTSDFGRIVLAIYPPDPRILYAAFDANEKYRLFKTENSGDRWTEIANPPSETQLWWNNALAIGRSPDLVYSGQNSLFRSIDGGRSGQWDDLRCCLKNPGHSPFFRNTDVHVDFHDLTFAPPDSFIGSPSTSELLFVANDGGIVKGIINDVGVVTWDDLTPGLIIGQCGGIAIAPAAADDFICGAWHVGYARTFDNGLTWRHPFWGAVDGRFSTFDATESPRVVYFECNASAPFHLCRTKLTEGLTMTMENSEAIDMASDNGRAHADPYRPGHLLRILDGKLTRHKNAANEAANTLQDKSQWEDMEVGLVGKDGSAVFARVKPPSAGDGGDPVYYMVTDKGQIWRGSKEAGWERVIDTGTAVTGLGLDLQNDARIVASFSRRVGPGRVKELVRQSPGSWTSTDIELTFKPDLKVKEVSSVAVHPLNSNLVFVGTDQGIYVGTEEGGAWVWRRSPGIPNVVIKDIAVHESADGASEVVRAATWGRGVYELVSSRSIVVPPPSPSLPPGQVAVGVRASRPGSGLFSPTIRAGIQVQSANKTGTELTPFESLVISGGDVTFTAPLLVDTGTEIVELVGWYVQPAAGGMGQNHTGSTITLRVMDNTLVDVIYRLVKTHRDANAGPLKTGLTVQAVSLCLPGMSHQLEVKFSVLAGQPPVRATFEFVKPDGQIESWTTGRMPPTEGALPLDFANGGETTFQITAHDAEGVVARSSSTVRLSNCPNPQVCDVNEDGHVDRNDINAIFAARNTPAAPADLADANGDGVITVEDARICALRCTNPECAP